MDTTVIVDGEETALLQLSTVLPQGSLLSLILSLFHNALLLEAFNLLDLRLSALGFANDINPLTYSESTAVNCTVLDSATTSA